MNTNKKHYVVVNGTQIQHSVFGSYKGEEVEVITIEGDYGYKELVEGKTDIHLGGCGKPNVFTNGEWTLYSVHIQVKEWHDATPTEKRKYNKVLKDNNLCFKTFVLKGVAPLTHHTYKMECENLCWIDTDKMPIKVNGKVMTYADFKKLTFGENMNVVNCWDNGYSHWGCETNKMESVYRLLNNICAECTENANDNINTTWRGGRVHCGELWTWQFDKHGVLKLSLTEEEIHKSYVSNT